MDASSNDGPVCQTGAKVIDRTITALKQLVETDPFNIRLADGRRVPVQHREFLMTSPSGRTVILYQPDDSFNIIDRLLVTDLEVKRNGSAQSNS